MEPSDRLSGKELDAYWGQVVADAWARGDEYRAQRDRLLAYVRAERALSRLLDDGPATGDQFWPLKQAEVAALRALIDAGDLEDDDGE